jgi:Domain of unknown function DUF11
MQMFVSKPLLFRPLLAAGLLASAVLGTASPAAAISPYAADLTVSITSLPTSSVGSGANMIYTLTVKNLATTHQVCEVIDSWPRPRTVCTTEPIGTAASGAVVQQTLPPGFAYRFSVPDHGFTCSASDTTVTCSNGYIDWGDTARIDIYATAATLPAGAANQSATTTATVNPSHAIPERDFNNNSGGLSLTVVAPPPLRADLVVTSFTGPAFVPAGGQATYTIGVANQGQASANVSTLLDGGLQAWEVVSSSGTPGFTPCYTSPERFSLRAWCPGLGNGPTLAPGQSATFSVVVRVSAAIGTFSMVAEVDHYNFVAESNESNNTASLTTTVY